MVLAGASLLVYPLTQWHLEQPLVQAEHECRRHSSVYGGFWKYFVFLQLQRALFALCALFPPGLVLCSPVSGVWVLLLEYRELDFSGDAVGRNAWLDRGDRLLAEYSTEFFVFSNTEERRCSVDASSEFLFRCSHLESGHYFYVDSWLTGGLTVHFSGSSSELSAQAHV